LDTIFIEWQHCRSQEWKFQFADIAYICSASHVHEGGGGGEEEEKKEKIKTNRWKYHSWLEETDQ
jgi:hypothetical protein